jgi:alpha-mannosidase/mannosylglycerate hydrolase
MSKQTIHVISHTHWDREWYMPFEKHRKRLVMLIDSLLDLIDNDPDFKHFHMDGQVIALEDYLEIRPQQADRIKQAAKDGRLSLGPWYVLQDEFLTSGEANIRNMIFGLKSAKKYGEPIKLGYLPDSFGNISQMPQILAGFGIDNAVFGRGINRWNGKSDSEADGYKSELIWKSPDGSEVLGIFMANWYANAMTIPTDPDQVLDYVNRVREACMRYATTSHLLFMNGCDHTPSQPDVSKAIKIANEKLDDAIMIHSNFADYIKSVKSEAHDLQVKVGELRSEYTDGWGTLTNVLSSRIYQKQANWRCQTLLEKWVEPFSAFASIMGGKYDSDMIWYAWKTLMQNHPHDSICGCSCDEVHREMDTRFEKCQILSEQLANDALETIAENIDINGLIKDSAKIVVFNPMNFPRKEMVITTVDFPENEDLCDLMVLDSDGNITPSFVLEDMGIVWDYKLPEVGFRIPYNVRRLKVAFLARVSGIGYATYQAIPADDEEDEISQVYETETLENEYLSVEILNDGRLNIIDKTTGITFNGLNQYQDSIDIGDEYNYRAPKDDEIITPYASDTKIGPILNNGVYSECTIETKLRLSGKPMDISFTLILPDSSRALYIRTEVVNEHKNHRLRVLFPSDINTEYASADGQFDVVKRKIATWEGWKNPSNCQPQQAFVDISDDEKGLTIANRGLPEYEILQDGKNTIAITLLRSIHQLGDWGVFPTPEAQCIGRHVFEYAIIPHANKLELSTADIDARAFNAPMVATSISGNSGKLSAKNTFIDLQPQKLVISSIKKAEERDSLIIRFYNPYDEMILGTMNILMPVKEAYLCNLAEEREKKIECIGGIITLDVPPKKIITIDLVLNN